MSVNPWKYDPNTKVEVDAAGLNGLVKGWIEKWQKILRLEDYDITFSIVRLFDMDDNAQASCRITLEKQDVHIRLLDPRDYDPTYTRKQDIEASIVHELLHIPMYLAKRISAASSGGDGSLGEEQAINSLTRALVSLDRRSGEELTS